MNYIAEIKAFHDLVQVKQLSTGQIALWYALMYINNKCAWIEWFTVPNLTLELNTGLSRSGIVKARNILKQLNIIDFKSNGTKATSYKLISMLNSVQVSTQIHDEIPINVSSSTQVGVQNGVQDSTQVGVQSSTQIRNALNKLNETKQNTNNTTTTESNSNSFSAKEFSDIAKLYAENIEQPNQLTAEWLHETLKTYGYEWFKNAIIEANRQGKRYQKYIMGILSNWKTGGGMKLEKDKSPSEKKTIYDHENIEKILFEKQNGG